MNSLRPEPILSHASRRRIIILLSAALTLLAIDLSVRHARPILNRYRINEYQQRPAALAAASPAPDIILLGSSRARYALVPHVFKSVTGQVAYNCAISGSKVVEWLTIARQAFAEHTPHVVVLGLNASELRADYCPAEAARNLFDWLDLIESCRTDGIHLEVIGGYLHSTIAPIWTLLDQRYALRMWGQEELAEFLPKQARQSRELRDRVARPMPSDGYYHPWSDGRRLQNLEVKLLRNVADVEAATPPEFSADSPTFSRLAQLLDWFAERNIRVAVAYLPNSPRTEARWKTIEPQMIARISEICRGCGAEFIPCEESRSNADFMEEIHMGLPLATRISRHIADRIVQRRLLPTEILAGRQPD